MKMKKFLAVVLLVAMCSSFMAVSASASGNGFNIGDFNPDGYGETPDTVVTPSEPEVPDVNAGGNGQADIIVGEETTPDEIDGAIAVKPEDTKLKDSTVAVIGDKEFDTIDAAVKASVMGDKITLVKDITVSSVWLKTQYLILDLGGHTITFNVGKGEENKGQFPGHPYCFWIQKDTEIKNGTVKIVPAVDDAFMLQNPIMVTDNAVLKMNAKPVYDKTQFAGTQFELYGGDGKVEDGTEDQEADFPILLNGQKYSNFKEAFAAANDGDTLELLRNTNGTGDLTVSKKLTINMGGNSIGNPGINVEAGADLTLVNGTVKSVNTEGNVTLGENTVAGDVKVTGKGMLNINVASVYVNSVSAPGAMNITAGSFAANPEAALGENYIASETDGTWVVSEKANVAEVNGNGYKTVKAAVDAAADGQTVAVKANVSENLTISGKNIVLDLGGNTLNGNITVEAGAGLTVQNGKTGDITVNGAITVTDKNVTAGKVTLGDKATVNVTAGTFANEFTVNSEYTFEKNDDGTFTVVEKVSLNPNSAKHIKGTNAGLEVKASAAIASVKRSDKPEVIDAQFYDLSADKTTLTFHADWLNQLTVGEYQIVFTFENGETKTFKLTVDTDTQVKLDPASFTYVKGEAKDTVFTVNQPVTGKVMFGDEEVSDKGFTLDENKTTLTLKADFLNNKNPGSYELKVGTDYGEALAGITVQVSVVVDPASQDFELQSDKDVTFTVTSSEDITAVSENGTDLTKDTDYTIKGKKLVFKAEYLNKLAAGSHEFVVRTANGSAKLTIQVAYSETSVTDASGKEISELKYFKGNSAMNNEFKFKTTPELNTLSVGNKVLTKGTDYDVLPNGIISISKDAKFLSELNAGQHALKFALSNGNTVDIKLLVYPSVKFSATHYTKGSNTDIEITVSDMADDILFGSELKPIEDNYWSYDSNSGKYTVSSKFFEAQPEGELPMGLRYGEMSFTLNGFKVNGNATIKPYNYVDKDGKSVWPYGSDTLGFKVSPDVKGVTIDGTELSDKQYSVDKNGILWIAASKLQKLNYGKHSIVVNTSYGDVEGEFYTKVGVEPKNEDYHVKGGKKNLSFVSSEPVKEVYVGREVLKSSYYSLSKDRMTITLNADFMNRLKADVTYSLTVTTEAGNASCNFRILSPGSAANRPQTGDESNMLIWAAVMVLSGAAVVALVPRKKKN